MLYGIISDIHSNLEALQVVVDELEKREIKNVICLGDIVGYGANPNECCNIVKELSQLVILGNHDAGSTGLTNFSYFNWVAKRACIWTSQVVTPENREWLKSLPFTLELNKDLFVHASPSKPEAWKYVLSFDDAISEFQSFKNSVCFVGHSHVPVTFVEKGSSAKGARLPSVGQGCASGTKYGLIQDSKFKLEPNYRYIINSGSIGQPRDADPRVSFAIYDNKKKEVEIIRLAYDIKTAQQKILDVKLPEFLASRLALGR
ncbi:metallophosphoesterase family protein [candidate division WOR-3 bacterium]|nr:metallophosphoesterase family protein [candidate division WOR-3 bacterium]